MKTKCSEQTPPSPANCPPAVPTVEQQRTEFAKLVGELLAWEWLRRHAGGWRKDK